jgi:hypothetical protein
MWIGDHIIAKRCLVSVDAITQSNHRPVIVLMHQYGALVKDGMTIHLSPQMEWNQVSVYDWLQCVGGHQ